MASADLTPLVAGNWKMNGLAVSEGELAKIVNGAAGLKADLMVCPPATLVASFAAAARDSALAIGGQDCHAEPSGAHTGDIAAEMLKDAGAVAVIVGHSERRTAHHETDAQVRAKAMEVATEIAQSAPLAIIATRETLRRGLAEAVARATEREYEEQDWLRNTADFKEGTKAMGERRLPNFQAR